MISKKLDTNIWEWIKEKNVKLFDVLKPDPFILLCKENNDYKRILSGDIDPGHYNRSWVWSLKNSVWWYYITKNKGVKFFRKYIKKFIILILLAVVYLMILKKLDYCCNLKE